jgi:hypothetical protein
MRDPRSKRASRRSVSSARLNWTHGVLTDDTIALRTRVAPACAVVPLADQQDRQAHRRRRPDPRARRWARRARRLPAAGTTARPRSRSRSHRAPRARRHQSRHQRRQPARQPLAVRLWPRRTATGTRRAPSAVPSPRTADHARPHLSAAPARPASTRTRRRRRARLRQRDRRAPPSARRPNWSAVRQTWPARQAKRRTRHSRIRQCTSTLWSSRPRTARRFRPHRDPVGPTAGRGVGRTTASPATTCAVPSRSTERARRSVCAGARPARPRARCDIPANGDLATSPARSTRC